MKTTDTKDAHPVCLSFGAARLSARRACKSFCVRGVGNGDCGQLPMSVGIRPSNTMAKWFKAAFQPTIGIVHFFDAS